MNFLISNWYQKKFTWLTLSLLPLSWLYGLVTRIRYILYKIGIKKSKHFPVPVVVVGNVTVGGTGKTPIVIALANYLKSQDYTVGIVSRGVGGREPYEPTWVEEDSDVNIVGDEALLLKQRTACPLVVCRDRVLAVETLLEKVPCQIILTDDGLQHYRLGRSLEIAVIDGIRELGNQALLPAGPLRESVSRLKSIDIIVRQGGEIKPQEFNFNLQINHWVNLKNKNLQQDRQHFLTTPVHAVAAIGNPERFFKVLTQAGLNIIPHVFKDHYLYKEQDLKFADAFPILMTEKDAVKCSDFANERFWYAPAEVSIDESFYAAVMDKLTQRVITAK